MVETGPLLGPAAIVVLLVLAVVGVVADGSRGDAGHTSRVGPLAAMAGCGYAPALAHLVHPQRRHVRRHATEEIR